MVMYVLLKSGPPWLCKLLSGLDHILSCHVLQCRNYWLEVVRHAPKVRTAAAANTVVALGTLAMRGLSIHGKCSTTMLVMWIQSTSDGDVVVCKLVDNPMTKLYM